MREPDLFSNNFVQFYSARMLLLSHFFFFSYLRERKSKRKNRGTESSKSQVTRGLLNK